MRCPPHASHRAPRRRLRLGGAIVAAAVASTLSGCVNDFFSSRYQTQQRQLELVQQYEQCVARSNTDPSDPDSDPARCNKYKMEIDSLNR